MSDTTICTICILAYIAWLLLFPVLLRLVTEEERIIYNSFPTMHFFSMVFPPFLVVDLLYFACFWYTWKLDEVEEKKKEWIQNRKAGSKEKLLRASEKPR